MIDPGSAQQELWTSEIHYRLIFETAQGWDASSYSGSHSDATKD